MVSIEHAAAPGGAGEASLPRREWLRWWVALLTVLYQIDGEMERERHAGAGEGKGE